jgi:hypothetical protein
LTAIHDPITRAHKTQATKTSPKTWNQQEGEEGERRREAKREASDMRLPAEATLK